MHDGGKPAHAAGTTRTPTLTLTLILTPTLTITITITPTHTLTPPHTLTLTPYPAQVAAALQWHGQGVAGPALAGGLVQLWQQLVAEARP